MAATRKQKPEKPDEPAVPELEIRNGAPVGGPLEVEVTEGDELRIDVTTDAPDELHLHSYDVYLDIQPGKTNELVVENGRHRRRRSSSSRTQRARFSPRSPSFPAR